VGNAVSRNRAKRLLKAHFINHIDKLKTGHYILVAKPLILNSDYHKLRKSFFNTLKRLKALKQ
jgi:ribonuclease P protein component